MKKEEKIKELENRQSELKDKFSEIISQPITEDSIKEAETTGVDIISESINNDIMLDILNWDDDSKLSETALKFKNSKQK
jgi:nicotinate-nucleotide pyrophosphorylase